MKTGDRVVCVRTHSRSDVSGVKKGKIFTVLGVSKCICSVISFDIGVGLNSRQRSSCYRCGTTNEGDIMWISSRLFAPIVEDEFLNSDEIEKIVEERIDIEIPIEA